MNSKIQIINDEYQKLRRYILEVDRGLKIINEKHKKALEQSKQMVARIYDILAKDSLGDEDLDFLVQGINDFCFELGNLNQSVFSLVCSHIIKEQQTTNMVREKNFQVLQAIVSKEDFSLFDSEENLESFQNLYKVFEYKNIDFVAILNYLTEKKRLQAMVNGSISRNGLTKTSIMVSRLCWFSDENDIKIYIYK